MLGLSMSSAISGPIALYNNVPIREDYYQPSRFVISEIELGPTTLVTTTEDMNYVIGQLVRLLIPRFNGSRQLNQQTGYVVSIPAPDQVEIAIDSSQNVDPFMTSSARTLPQIVPVGDVNTGIISSTGRNIPTTNIPGAFINISP